MEEAKPVAIAPPIPNNDILWHPEPVTRFLFMTVLWRSIVEKFPVEIAPPEHAASL